MVPAPCDLTPRRRMSDVSQLAARIRDSNEPLRIVGGGSWLRGGGPWAEATPLDVGHLRGVVEYTPGDLVITVMAGTTVAELAAITGEHLQMFALAPYGSPQATIGAVIATAAAAPLAFGDYAVRDLVLGVQVVTGNGDITRAGGHVVKNVAGFDLVRLHTGAFGTLGVITEVSLRLHARPAVDTIVAGTLRHSDSSSLDNLLPRLVANRAPLPMLLHRAPGAAPVLWARVSGNAARAEALRTHLQGFDVAPLHVVEPAHVTDTLQCTPDDAIVFRARTHRSDAGPFVRAAFDAFPDGTILYDPARGSLRAVLPAMAIASLERDLATMYRLAAANGAMHPISVVVDQGRSVTSPHSTPRSALEAGVKRAFDPRDMLNRLAAVSHANLAHADV
jgi:glycolate oxidase FAD binding subunit